MKEFLVENSGDGKVYDISETVFNITHALQMNSGAGKLTFDYIKSGVMFTSGSVVRFKYKGHKIFYGFIFDSTNSEGDTISVVAYDQLRYLKYKDSLMIKNFTSGSLVKHICGLRKLKPGDIEDTKHSLTNRISQNKTDLDTIYDSMDETLISTKKKYILYDNFGSINLKEAKNLKLPLIIGDESLAYGYSYRRSIDGETYNKVKIAQKQKDKDGNTFLNQTHVAEDKATQKKWGVLQFYEEVDENMTTARMKQRAQELLSLYNHEERSLTLPCLGDPRVIVGSGIRVVISNLQIDSWFIVKSVTHKFETIHTMEVELIVL